MGVALESSAPATDFNDARSTRGARAFDFIEWTLEPECALVVQLDPSGRPLTNISLTSGGPVPFRERTVAALEDANNQIKRACLHRPAPGLVMLVPQGRSSSAPMMTQAACYGQQMVDVSLTRDNEPAGGGAYVMRDGVFRPDKNRHISAALLLERSGAATYFPNPWTLRPILETCPVFSGAQRAQFP